MTLDTSVGASGSATPLSPAQDGSVAHALASLLQEAGIDTFFGVPGGAIEPLLDALAPDIQAGNVRFVLTRHEAGGAFMADGFYRESGQMAACLSTSGPGATNMLTAAASALVEEVPVLFITAQTTLAKFGRNALQESSSDGIDTVELFSKVTKYSSLVSHPSQLVPKLCKALSLAQRGPRGPVHLALPTDILKARLSTAELPAPSRLFDALAGGQYGPSQVRHVADVLQAAQRPVVWLGEHSAQAAAELMPLLERAGVAVVTSPAAKDWLPWTHSGFRGVLGFGGHASAWQAVDRADVVLAVGVGLREMCTEGWSTRVLDGRLVLLAEHAEQLHNAPQAKAVAVGDLAAIAAELAALLQARAPLNWEPCPRAFEPTCLPQSPLQGKVHTGELMQLLGDKLPLESRVYLDAGNCWAWSIHHLPVNERVRKVRIAMSFGSMGWGLSASIGAKLALPATPVFCLVGDGAWLMSSAELSTAVAEHLPVVFIVLNDSVLGMVKHGQRLAGAARLAYQLPVVDYALLAQSMGAHGQVVASRSQLEHVDWASLALREGPTVVDVRIDSEAVPPMQVRSQSLKVLDPS